MSYSVLQDLVDRFGEQELIQLTDRDDLGQVDTGVVDASIADADDLIDSWLSAGGYGTPLVQIPNSINRAACDIVRYYLWEDETSDEVRNRYTDAIKYLNQIGTGKVSLSLGAADQANDQGTPVGQTHVQPGESGTDWGTY